MLKQNINYGSIELMVDLLSQRIEGPIDGVIAIGRGGLIPGTILGYKLGKRVYNLGISTYNGATREDDYTIYQKLDLSELPPSNFVVIDDICDTGNTFKIFDKLYNPNKTERKHNFTYVSLFAKDKSVKYVNYYGLSVPDDVWLVFPWEL